MKQSETFRNQNYSFYYATNIILLGIRNFYYIILYYNVFHLCINISVYKSVSSGGDNLISNTCLKKKDVSQWIRWSSYYLIIFGLLVGSSFKIKATWTLSATLFSIWQCSHIFSVCWLSIRSSTVKKRHGKGVGCVSLAGCPVICTPALNQGSLRQLKNVLYIPITEQHSCVVADALLQQHCPLLRLHQPTIKKQLLQHCCSTYINTQAP